MPKYMVERFLPGATADHLSAAATRARNTTAQMTRQGTPVRYLRSTFIPGEDRCFCLFEGPSAEIIREANERAALPVGRIVEVVHVASEDLL